MMRQLRFRAFHDMAPHAVFEGVWVAGYRSKGTEVSVSTGTLTTCETTSSSNCVNTDWEPVGTFPRDWRYSWYYFGSMWKYFKIKCVIAASCCLQFCTNPGEMCPIPKHVQQTEFLLQSPRGGYFCLARVLVGSRWTSNKFWLKRAYETMNSMRQRNQTIVYRGLWNGKNSCQMNRVTNLSPLVQCGSCFTSRQIRKNRFR